MFYRRKNGKGREGPLVSPPPPSIITCSEESSYLVNVSKAKKKSFVGSWACGRKEGKFSSSSCERLRRALICCPFLLWLAQKKIRRFFSMCGILWVRAESTAIFSPRDTWIRKVVAFCQLLCHSKKKFNFASCGGWRWEGMMATWVMFSPSFH